MATQQQTRHSVLFKSFAIIHVAPLRRARALVDPINVRVTTDAHHVVSTHADRVAALVRGLVQHLAGVVEKICAGLELSACEEALALDCASAARKASRASPATMALVLKSRVRAAAPRTPALERRQGSQAAASTGKLSGLLRPPRFHRPVA